MIFNYTIELYITNCVNFHRLQPGGYILSAPVDFRAHGHFYFVVAIFLMGFLATIGVSKWLVSGCAAGDVCSVFRSLRSGQTSCLVNKSSLGVVYPVSTRSRTRSAIFCIVLPSLRQSGVPTLPRRSSLPQAQRRVQPGIGSGYVRLDSLKTLLKALASGSTGTK